MNRLTRTDRIVLAAALGWLAVNLLILKNFPTVFLDEAENANHAWNLAYHGQAVFSLYDGLYPTPLYALRHAWPVVIRPFYCIPLACTIRLLGFSLFTARAFSTVTAFLVLLLVYAIGARLRDRRLGWTAMAVLGTRFIFLYCADRIRPELWLCLCGVLSFAAFLGALGSTRPWFALAAGFFAGIAPGIHTNGVALIVPVIVLLLVESRWKSAAWSAAGWLGGFSWFLLSADWESFLPGARVLFFQEFAGPSLLRYHGNLFLIILTEFERYFKPWIFDHWRAGEAFYPLAGWQYLLAAAALAWGWIQKGKTALPARFGALLAASFALIVGQRSFPYVSVLEPYFALAIAAWVLTLPNPGWASVLQAVGLVLILYPLGNVPLMLALSLAVLPKKAWQAALLVLLLSCAMQPLEIRLWLVRAVSDYHALWWAPSIGVFCLGAVRMFAGSSRVRWNATARQTSGGARQFMTAAGWGVLALTSFGTVVFVGGIATQRPTFEQVCRELSSAMRPGARVAGPQIFWLGLSQYDYRDIGGVVWFRLLTNDRDALAPLAQLRPDYLILDRPFVNRVVRSNRELKRQRLLGPTGLFPWPHRVIQVLHTGLAYGEDLALVENQWPARR